MFQATVQPRAGNDAQHSPKRPLGRSIMVHGAIIVCAFFIAVRWAAVQVETILATQGRHETFLNSAHREPPPNIRSRCLSWCRYTFAGVCSWPWAVVFSSAIARFPPPSRYPQQIRLPWQQFETHPHSSWPLPSVPFAPEQMDLAGKDTSREDKFLFLFRHQVHTWRYC